MKELFRLNVKYPILLSKIMKPKRIYLVRHAQSKGNVDPEEYYANPAYTMEITELGVEQAHKAGKKLKKLIGTKPIQFINSPLWRTRSTLEIIASYFELDQYKFKEDARIRTQEWGAFRTQDENKQLMSIRDAEGPFYYRVPGGEAVCNVYDRVFGFIETLHREFKSKDYPENLVIVTHGMPFRLIMMILLGWSTEEFEQRENPDNCEIIELKLKGNIYKEVLPLKKHKKSEHVHPFQRELTLDKNNKN
ncbi:MAG: histidine phosphatase family protein [Patescibacteria group bacterium]